jgi:hypothetical protein
MPPRLTPARRGRPPGRRPQGRPIASPTPIQAPVEAISSVPRPSSPLLAVWRAGASLADLAQLLGRPLEALEADLRVALTAQAPSPRRPRTTATPAPPAPRGPRPAAPPATPAPRRPKPTRRPGRPTRRSAPPPRPRPASRVVVLERVRAALMAAPPQGWRVSMLSVQCGVPLARLRRLLNDEVAAGRLVRDGLLFRLPAPPSAAKPAARPVRGVQAPDGEDFEVVWPPAEDSA